VAENAVCELDPRRSIGRLLCPVPGERQVGLEKQFNTTMCGRYTESNQTADVKARIAFDWAQMELMPRFNMAPRRQKRFFIPVESLQVGERNAQAQEPDRKRQPRDLHVSTIIHSL
jgi:hypothetical protein